MILMPQELNAEFESDEIRKLLVTLAKKENVVVIVPSKPAAEPWQAVADQILLADNAVDGIAKLRQKHVGLTVLVNRYDGIDLPHDACRVLAIVGLPEVTSYTELTDMAVLSDSQSGLRRQMQRTEQGMGRGVRSNDDYCVVLLIGAKLTARVKSPKERPCSRRRRRRNLIFRARWRSSSLPMLTSRVSKKSSINASIATMTG